MGTVEPAWWHADRRWTVVIMAAVLLCGCDNSSLTLLVQLRTNFRPAVEFDRVEVSWRPIDSAGNAGALAGTVTRGVEASSMTSTGFVIAEFRDPMPGLILIEVRLFLGDVPVGDDARLLRLRRSTAVTLLVSRECGGVECPTEGLTACIGGVCVDPRCTPESPEFCPFGCTTDSQCDPEMGPDCVQGLCFAGTCVTWPDDSRCAGGACDPTVGCDNMSCMDDSDCTVGPDALVCEVGACLGDRCYPQRDDSLCPSGRCDDFTDCEAAECGAPGPASSIVEITAGGLHACARAASGSVYCWGRNEFGQLGDGTRTDRSTATAVLGLTDAVAIAAGGTHTCALRTGGAIVCWGRNEFGQLGDGTLEDRLTPTSIPGVSASALALGSGHTCAQVGTSAWCWGDNREGQLGDGTETSRADPSMVSGLGDVAALSASASFTCALRMTGEVACWGDNRQRQLGDPARNYFDDSSTPVAVVGVSTATTISAGAAEACVQRADGEFLCWGDFEELPMGEGFIGDGGPMARVLPELRGISSLFASTHRCGLRAGGDVVCWGVNRHGALGDGTVNPSSLPVRARCLTGIEELALGYEFTCARGAAGDVSCWGSNAYGSLGDGTNRNHLTPVSVRGLP